MLWNQEWANNLVKTKKPIFLVDAMLGKLAKKLRFLGYDTIYYSSKDDDELIQIAKTEKRILITKDVQLVKKCIKKQVETIELVGLDEIEQFIQINEEIVKSISIDDFVRVLPAGKSHVVESGMGEQSSEN